LPISPNKFFISESVKKKEAKFSPTNLIFLPVFAGFFVEVIEYFRKSEKGILL
jgi:hypothetical protein